MPALACVFLAMMMPGMPPGVVEHSNAWPDTAKELNAVDQVRADVVFDAMLATLAKIRSGDVQVFQEVSPSVDSYARDNRLYFDHARQYERWDQLSGRFAQRIRAADETILHSPRHVLTRSGTTKRYPGTISVNDRKNEAEVVGTIPIDMRVVGIGNLAHLRNHWTWETYDEYRAANDSLFPATLSYIDESDLVFTDLVWVGNFSKERPTKVLLRLDRSRDFIPVLNAVFVQEKGEPFKLISQNSAQWERLNDVWVPQQWKLSLKTPSITHELEFKWESVNQPIDPQRFTIEDLDAPRGTPVIDARIRDRVVIKRRVGQ